MKRQHAIVICILAGVILFSIVSICWSESNQATKQECVAKTKEAAQVIQREGIEAALKQINDRQGPFVWKDTYVFISNPTPTK